MMTKNILIVASLLFVIFVVAVAYQGTCDYKALGTCWRYWDQTGEFIETLLITVPFFLISLIVRFTREEIFRTWIKFALVWIPLTMFLTLISPEYSQSLLPIVKSTVSFGFSALFFFISLIIIAYKYFTTRPGK